MKRFSLIAVLFVLAAGLLAACQPQTAPAPAAGTEPPAAAATDAPTAIPTPSAEKGTITGVVAKKVGESDEEVYPNIRLYVGILLIDSTGQHTLARVDEKNAPQTRTDANGRFVFKDLDPGKYILVVQVPPNNLMKLNHPETGRDMVIELAAGDLKDMGTLYYDLPFEPQHLKP